MTAVGAARELSRPGSQPIRKEKAANIQVAATSGSSGFEDYAASLVAGECKYSRLSSRELITLISFQS
jgi:hypothetical protein